jgi:hypothetical protein
MAVATNSRSLSSIAAWRSVHFPEPEIFSRSRAITTTPQAVRQKTNDQWTEQMHSTPSLVSVRVVNVIRKSALSSKIITGNRQTRSARIREHGVESNGAIALRCVLGISLKPEDWRQRRSVSFDTII